MSFAVLALLLLTQACLLPYTCSVSHMDHPRSTLSSFYFISVELRADVQQPSFQFHRPQSALLISPSPNTSPPRLGFLKVSIEKLGLGLWYTAGIH